MSIKLITSSGYANNFNNYTQENQFSKTSKSEKVEKLFKKIIDGEKFIFNKNLNSEENKKITKYIIKLIGVQPGRELFKRLLKTDKPLEFVFNSKKHPSYRHAERKIFLNDSKVYYALCVDSDGKKVLSPIPKFIIFAHELIHALHYVEEGAEVVREKKTQEVLDADFDNLEEQETIIGKEGEPPLCENIFRFSFGYPLRIDHQTLCLDQKGPLTLSECAVVGALDSLVEKVVEDFSLLGSPQPIRYRKWWRQKGGLSKEVTSLPHVTPLNAAIFKNRRDVIDYLFQWGVDINAKDSYWGTPLHLAVKEKHLDLMKELVSLGANAQVKDCRGATPLRLALNLIPRFKTIQSSQEILFVEEAIAFLAPLTHLNEVDEEGFSILHHAMETYSLAGFNTLIRCGADVNCKDSKGNTPLMYSICGKNLEDKFKALLDNDKLAINAKNASGKTALSFAVAANNAWQVKDLVERGAEIPNELKDRVNRLKEQAFNYI